MWWKDDERITRQCRESLTSNPQTHITTIPVNLYCVKTIDASLHDPGPELQLTLPLDPRFRSWVLSDSGPEHLALPRDPRFRIITSKAQDCMDEVGTHIYLQPARFAVSTWMQPVYFFLTVGEMMNTNYIKWKRGIWKWRVLMGR